MLWTVLLQAAQWSLDVYKRQAIDCVSDGCVRPAEDIAAEIYAHIQRCLEE